MAAPLADRVYVMYSGRIVESGSMRDVLSKPMHPYTAELIGSARKLYLEESLEPAYRWFPNNTYTSRDTDIRSRASNTSCRYLERCPYLFEKCLREPDLIEVDNRSVRCWLYG
jgi:ABC-type dipeptide/oligopeptide/nickel transport system ATPase component